MRFKLAQKAGGGLRMSDLTDVRTSTALFLLPFFTYGFQCRSRVLPGWNGSIHRNRTYKRKGGRATASQLLEIDLNGFAIARDISKPDGRDRCKNLIKTAKCRICTCQFIEIRGLR